LGFGRELHVQKIVGVVLAFLGAFLLVAGILAQIYAPDRLMKTPIDVDSTTNLYGEAELADGEGGTDVFPVRAWSINLADSEASTEQVVLFQNSSCLVKDEGEIDGCVSADDPQERLLTASTDTFATDRETALAVNDPDILPASAEPKEGLINKWPFDAEQTTYPYWDGTAGEAVDAVFDREEEVEGLTTYVYKITVEDVPIELSEGVTGVYNDEKEIYVDPTTGSIIHQVDHQERIDDEGNPFLIVDLEFTPEEVTGNVEEAEDNASSLNLVRDTVPLIGYAAGIPLLLIGLALIYLAQRSRPAADAEKAG
jgi:hypothetical protein